MQYLSEQTADQGGGSYMADQSAQPNTGGGDQIPLSRADYDKLQRQAARAEELESRVKESEQDWGHVRNLLRPGTDPSRVEDSIRKVMSKEGYNPEEIEQYIQEQRGEEVDDTPDIEEVDENSEAVDFVRSTKSEIEGLKASARKSERDRLESVLNNTVDATIDEDTELGKLITTLAPSLQEEEGGTERVEYLYQTLLGEVKRETLERLRVRRIREGGRWNDSWIREEAANAAKSVHGKYRAIYPNPSKLGRSSDYSAEQDYVTNTQPVKAPEYKRGMNPADVSREARGWAVDQLLRASADAERNSKSDSPI
jgi:hypothetical protein